MTPYAMSRIGKLKRQNIADTYDWGWQETGSGKTGVDS